jgi:hypothetical protein
MDMVEETIFRQRLRNILTQLSEDQQTELMPNKKLRIMDDDEVETVHTKFIDIQYSGKPFLAGTDIRHVLVFPYKS